MSKISLYPEGKVNKDGKLAPAVSPFTNIEFDEYLIKIKEGEFQDEVLSYRTGKIEKLKLEIEIWFIYPIHAKSYNSRVSITFNANKLKT